MAQSKQSDSFLDRGLHFTVVSQEEKYWTINMRLPGFKLNLFLTYVWFYNVTSYKLYTCIRDKNANDVKLNTTAWDLCTEHLIKIPDCVFLQLQRLPMLQDATGCGYFILFYLKWPTLNVTKEIKY